MKRSLVHYLITFVLIATFLPQLQSAEIRSARSGNWSDPETWDSTVPSQGDNVVIDSGHVVTYDVVTDAEVRLVHIRGKLTFSRSVSTQLDVGMIIVSKADSVDVNENCSTHHGTGPPWDAPLPTLEIGTYDSPIPSGITARVRLVHFADMNMDCAPGIIVYGSRMDLHGTPLNRTWVKLGATSPQGSNAVTLSESVSWKAGDRVIITRSRKPIGMINTQGSWLTSGLSETEERVVASVSGNTLTLDRPLDFPHPIWADHATEVANLSRNVVIESKYPDAVRGHTMYHMGSKGSISYTEFAHLGKAGVLARYPIHFHRARNSMRGSFVIGASIWDSHNRFVTVHGTDYMVVRDCVGYQSLGHGFFLEDATEVYNLFQRNLAVLTYDVDPLPNQALTYDGNDGAGFWWANGRNAFLSNVANEVDQYGFQFDIQEDIFGSVLQPDGTIRDNVQINKLAFIKFRSNEAHATLNYGFWGNGDALYDDPFLIEDFSTWGTWYALGIEANNFFLKNLHIYNTTYGLYAEYPKNGRIENLRAVKPGDHAMSFQEGPEGLITLNNVVIDSSDAYPFRIYGTGQRRSSCDIHVQNYSITNTENGWDGAKSSPLSRATPDLTLYLHDWFGANQDAKVIPVIQNRDDGLTYENMAPVFAEDVKVAVTSVPFPDNPIVVVDDLPPATVILSPSASQIISNTNHVIVTGTCIDASRIAHVIVNGVSARALGDNFTRWVAELGDLPSGDFVIEALATDKWGNAELTPHQITVLVDRSSAPDVETAVGAGMGIGLDDDWDEAWETPTATTLIGNYPNPFNPSTTFRYTLSEPNQVSLKVYNMIGQLVRTVVNEQQAEGYYEAIWDGRNETGSTVSSGIYIYRMTAGSFVETKRMLFVK